MREKTYLSVIIPAHNEETRIGKTFGKICNCLVAQPYSSEIIVADDKSTDDTVGVVRQWQKNIAPGLPLKNLILARVPPESPCQGKGVAVRQGMLKARGEYCISIDADNGAPFEQIEGILPKVKNYDILIGSRYVPGAKIIPKRGAFRTFVSRGGNLFIRLFLQLPFADTRCPFKIFSSKAAKEIFPQVRLPSFGFDDEALVIARLHNFKVKEVPVEWHDVAESKVSLKDMMKSFGEIVQIKWNKCLGKYK